jgi:hypothetical protein
MAGGTAPPSLLESALTFRGEWRCGLARNGLKSRGTPLAIFDCVLCRIEVRRENHRVAVHLAGHLSEAQVPDLLEVCAAATGAPIVVLDEMLSADAVGIDALLRIEQNGAQLVGLPQYLRLELDALTRRQVR